MNIAIFGASRGVGRAAAEIAASQGHAVTAVARGADVPVVPGITSITGSVFDASLVSRAIDRADAVLVALGTAPGLRAGDGQAQVCSRGTGVILDAMGAAALKRIVVVSSYGVGPTKARRPFPFNLVAATLLRDVMSDKEVQEGSVRASATDWTIAQPLGLTDEPASGLPYVSTDGSRQVTRVPRRDVAAVCIDAITNRRYVRQTIAISGSG